jgi:hypothetical protein
MIELEHKRVRKATVDARRFAKTFQHDPDIAPVCRHPRARKFDLTVFGDSQLVMDDSLSRRVTLVTISA